MTIFILTNIDTDTNFYHSRVVFLGHLLAKLIFCIHSHTTRPPPPVSCVEQSDERLEYAIQTFRNGIRHPSKKACEMTLRNILLSLLC